MLKRALICILLRLLDASFKVDYKKIDQKALEDWAFRSHRDPGLMSYFAYEDMKILKEFSFGKAQDAYWILIGRRLQLLYMFDEFRKGYENKKSAEAKAQAKATGQSK